MNVIHDYLIFIKTLWSEKMLGLFFSREKKIVYNCISSERHLFNPNESKYIVLFTKQTVKKIHIK